MSKTVKIQDCDIVFLSYDEPNCEQNWADLLSKVPWAKRVHGVKGPDRAHKECAMVAETPRFITVDGDSMIDPRFIDQVIEVEDNIDIENSVLSWCGQNSVNGLLYGNGGLKGWPKHYVLNMKTHEAADTDRAQVDFCWEGNYYHLNKCFCKTVINSTPEQAWRAGFREGVKMTLDRGIKVDAHAVNTNHWKNLDRLYIWQMVGADVDNGLWAILGARQGSYLTNLTDFDWIQIRDSDYLRNYFKTEVSATITNDNIMTKIIEYGQLLVEQLHFPIDAQPLSELQSRFHKTVYRNPERTIKGFMDDTNG